MQHAARIRFNAELEANGDITPGAAVDGFLASALDSDAVGYHCLLENPATSDWQICFYNPNAASGSRRTMVQESGTALTTPMAGLVCTLIAPVTAYVAASGSNTSPVVDSTNSVAVGGGASVGSTAGNSVAVGNAATASNINNVMVGADSAGTGARATAVGKGAYANAEDYEPGRGCTALGADAQTTAMGETALGSRFGPHVGFIPVQAPAGADTAGTYTMLAIGGFDIDTYVRGSHDLPDKCIPSGTGMIFQGVRFQGVITATADSAANHKTWDVDYFVDSAAARWANFTVKHAGANNVAITFAVSASGELTVTTPTVAGLVISGLLMVSKIVY